VVSLLNKERGEQGSKGGEKNGERVRDGGIEGQGDEGRQRRKNGRGKERDDGSKVTTE